MESYLGKEKEKKKEGKEREKKERRREGEKKKKLSSLSVFSLTTVGFTWWES